MGAVNLPLGSIPLDPIPDRIQPLNDSRRLFGIAQVWPTGPIPLPTGSPGRQQLDEAEHAREQELQQRTDDLEKDVDRLEQALAVQGSDFIPLDRAVSSLRSGRGCPQRGAVQPTSL